MPVIIRPALFLGAATGMFSVCLQTAANEVVLIRPEIKQTEITAPCPVRLDFQAYIMADEFGDIEYRWVRSDEQRMPTETLSLPAAEKKRSGYVTMTWEVSPANTPGGREYWADVEIISPDSLGSSGAARVRVECDGVVADAGGSGSGSTSVSSDSLGDDAFVLGDESDEDELVVGNTGDPQTLEVPPIGPAGPAKSTEIICPVRQVGIRIADPLPTGWSRSGSTTVATGTLVGPTVANTSEGVRLVCLYQDGRWRLPLTRPIPDGYTRCDVDGAVFRCTN